MIKTLLISVTIIISFCIQAFACKCVLPGPSIEKATHESDFIFIGRCISGEFKEEGEISLPETYTYKLIWTFEVQKKFKGKYETKQIEVETGLGFGDCGFPFKLGLSYLIYANNWENNVGTTICSRTKTVGIYPVKIDERVKTEIDKLENINR